jgi:hypothetical protein
MFTYLKKTLFCLFILLLPYMNTTSNAVPEDEEQRSSTPICQMQIVKDDQQDVSSLVSHSTLPQGTWEEWKKSGELFATGAAKDIAQVTYGAAEKLWYMGKYLGKRTINYAVNNPEQVIVDGVIVTACAAVAYYLGDFPGAAAAATAVANLTEVLSTDCACYCFNQGVAKFYGKCYRTEAECKTFCSDIRFSFAWCLFNDKCN